jgi:N-methylhydantoinase B/oxoprolinase/acetone carboxylase alpha subunit
VREFYVASRGHHADIGGVTPGSMPPDSSHVDEEGSLLDNVQLVAHVRRVRFLEPMTAVMLANTGASRRSVSTVARRAASDATGSSASTGRAKTTGRRSRSK